MATKYTLSVDKLSYRTVADNEMLYLIQTSREGLDYEIFRKIALQTHFSMNDWSGLLHISERTLQRYRKEKRKFNLPLF